MDSSIQVQPVINIETVAPTEAEALSMQQQCALRHLAEGKSIAATARLIGMTRMTVHHWLRKDALFSAAFNSWRTELRVSTQARLAVLCDKAVDSVEASLSNPDGKIAMKLLMGMGMVSPQKAESEDAEEILMQQDLERRRWKRQLQTAISDLEMDELMAEMANIRRMPKTGAISSSKV